MYVINLSKITVTTTTSNASGMNQQKKYMYKLDADTELVAQVDQYTIYLT